MYDVAQTIKLFVPFEFLFSHLNRIDDSKAKSAVRIDGYFHFAKVRE
jgi:hypothetical protein